MNDEAVFAEALGIPEAHQRREFVRRACGDDAPMRQRVNSLLAAHDSAGDFMVRLASELQLDHKVTETPSAAELLDTLDKAGDVIGPYRLVELLGEGGMGVVFRAEQTEPVRRDVALKIMKPGLGSRDAVTRFQTECQALAMMDHPSIAKVFDVGVTKSRRPYLAMELVDGSPLTQSCNERSMPLTERLKLFAQACHAVQHAHRRGVIHRDLKPSNILVSARRDKPRVTIVDFGVAKALSVEYGLEEAVTRFGQIVGTPQYMSPEQARAGRDQVDTRTDVYSLGVVLYELLTGTTPLEAQQVTESPLADVLRTVREVVPAAPSKRLHDSTASPSSKVVADIHPSEVRGELDWIVMKALDKDPERRYQSAEQLSRDVERFLAGEPIDARRDSSWYVLRKTLRRHRIAAATTAAFLVVALTAFSITLVALRKAVTERNSAIAASEAERQARADEAAQRLESDKQRDESEFQAYVANLAAAAGAQRIHDVVDARQRLDSAPEKHRGWEWRQLFNSLDDRREAFVGHGDRVEDVAFAPNGNVIATTSMDATVRLWDAESGRLLDTIHGQARASIAWCPDGDLLAIGRADGIVQLWDIETHEFTRGFQGPCNRVAAIAVSNDGSRLAAAFQPRGQPAAKPAVLVWDLPYGDLLQTIAFERRFPPNDIAISHDGGQLATTAGNGTIVWDVTSGSPRLRLQDQAGTDSAIAFSHNGSTLATAGNQNVIRLWETSSGKPLLSLSGHTGSVNSVAFGPRDEYLVSGARDRTVRVWRTQTGEQLRLLVGHTWNITSVAISPDGSRIASSSWDTTAALWDGVGISDGDLLAAHVGKVVSVAFAPAGRQFATASWDHTVKLWDLHTRSEVGTFSGHAAPVQTVAFSPNGNMLASAAWDSHVKLWEVATGRELTTLDGHAKNSRVHALAFSPDGEWLVSGSSDDTLRIWDTETYEQLAVLTGHQDHIHAVDVSDDGERIASAGHHSIRIWDARRRVEVAKFERRMLLDDYSLAFHPDNRRLAAGSDIRTMTIWDVIERRPIRELTGHTDEIHAIAFSPDGQRMVSAAFDNAVKIWDTASGRELATLFGYPGHANHFAFSPDGRYLVAGLDNGMVKIWDGGSPHSMLTAVSP